MVSDLSVCTLCNVDYLTRFVITIVSLIVMIGVVACLIHLCVKKNKSKCLSCQRVTKDVVDKETVYCSKCQAVKGEK